MCNGSKHAVESVMDEIAKKKDGQRIVLCGRLLHNEDVINMLKQNNAITINNDDDFFKNVLKTDMVIIRAHGERKAFLDAIKSKGFNYRDCTCIKVDRIHKQIEKKFNDGYSIIIIGDKDHAEVKGSNGWCADSAKIISKPDSVDSLDDNIGQKIFVIGQTTFNKACFVSISDKIKKKYKNATVEIENSLCDATHKIQYDSSMLAKRCNTMIVIGDEGSANTKDLFDECKAVCPDTRLIEGRDSLYNEIIETQVFDFSLGIGITGGASTPRDVIDDCKRLLEFRMFYQASKDKIKDRVKEYDHILLTEKDPIIKRNIEQFAKISSSKKAKMIRGTLIMLGYKMTKKDPLRLDDSVDLAAAYEYFETAILAHDDVFDKADARRGEETIHIKNYNMYKSYDKEKKQIDNIYTTSEAIAICMGDMGFFFLNQMLLKAYRNNENLVKILECFNDIAITTIRGELIDVVLPLEERLCIEHDADIEDLVIKIDTMKTAEYTIIGPLVLGMILGGAKNDEMEKIRDFAKLLGIVFQIKDDWLNIFGSHEQGKPCGTDISKYKMTLLYADVCKDNDLKTELLKYYGKEKIDDNDLQMVKRIMEKSGAKKQSECKISEYLETCKKKLEEMDFIDNEDKELLYGFILFLELRSR
jgi:(E)-4-hydroxy-3-methyl-but-2-enyl pyrophosphate reductase